MTRHKKAEPDTAACITREAGAVIPGSNREMYYCGIDNADCKFARAIGWDFVCKHPDNDTFVSTGSADSELVLTNPIPPPPAKDLSRMQKQ